MYYAQFCGKLSNSQKELIPASLFHLREADILIGDWHSFLVWSPSWHTSVLPLLQKNKQLNSSSQQCRVLKKSCRQDSKKSVCLVSHCIIKSICFAWLCIIASVGTQVIYFNTLHSAHLPIFLATPRKTASYPPAIREAREGCRRDRTAEVLLCAARLKIMLRWKRGSPALVAHNGRRFQRKIWFSWKIICLKQLQLGATKTAEKPLYEV